MMIEIFAIASIVCLVSFIVAILSPGDPEGQNKAFITFWISGFIAGLIGGVM